MKALWIGTILLTSFAATTGLSQQGPGRCQQKCKAQQNCPKATQSPQKTDRCRQGQGWKRRRGPRARTRMGEREGKCRNRGTAKNQDPRRNPGPGWRKGPGGNQGPGGGRGPGGNRGPGGGRGPGGNRGKAGRPGALRFALKGRRTQKPVPTAYLETLQAVLVEEYYARDTYRLAYKTTGSQVFSNLARAEQHHIEGVETAIQFLGGTPTSNRVKIAAGPKGLLAAKQRCRSIERNVIQAYDKLIRTSPDPRLLPLLKRIQQANHRHLRAVGG